MKKYLPLLFGLFFCLDSVSAQQLISTELKESLSLSQMQAQFGLLMENGVDMYKITYTTVDIEGTPDTASGLVVVPVREENYAYPLLVSQHGTIGEKDAVPSNIDGGWQLGAVFGGQAYVSIMPDFLGLGESRGFHPYLHTDSEAWVTIDMLFAARAFADQQGIALSDQLFITGYSQGGHAAAAVHKEIQENWNDDFVVTASAPLSGPYSISGVSRDVLLGGEEYFFPAYVPYLFLSYNLVYGISYEAEQLFIAPYAAEVDKFLNQEITLGELNEELIAGLLQNEGASIPKFLLQDSILQIIASGVDHPFNDAQLDNDLFDWAPQAPTRLFYCMADDQVSFRNSIVADSVMNLNGAPDVLSFDLDSDADHNECVEPALIATSLFFGSYKNLVVVATEQPDPSKPLRVFPNPADNVLYLKTNAPAGIIELLDNNGRSVLRKNRTQKNEFFSIAHLPEGLYLLRITAEGKSWSEKVVILR